VEDQAQDYTIRVLEGGTRIIVQLSKANLSWLSRQLGLGVRKARQAVHNIQHSGEVSARTLQQGNTSLQVQEIEAGQKHNIVRELKRQGITFHVERDRATGGVFLHFSGNDAAEVKHAVDKIVARLNQQAERDESPAHAQSNQTIDWNEHDASNPGFDFTTVQWDPQASVIATNLDERAIPFRQETVDEHTQRFTYPPSKTEEVAAMIDALDKQEPGIDWNHVNPVRAETRTPPVTPDTGTRKKTKRETINAIKQRAKARVETKQTAPRKTHTKTR
jgi:hypothetical protein